MHAEAERRVAESGGHRGTGAPTQTLCAGVGVFDNNATAGSFYDVVVMTNHWVFAGSSWQLRPGYLRRAMRKINSELT